VRQAGGAWQRAAHLLPAFFAGGGLGEPASVPPIGGTGATRPVKKKPTCALTSVAQAAGPPGLPPPRHPALGFAPQDPECDAAVCRTLDVHAPVVPTAGCCRGNGYICPAGVRLETGSASVASVLCGKGLGGEPARVPPIGGAGATRPAKRKPICTTTSVAQAARPPGLPPPRHPALGFAPQPPNVMPVLTECLMHMPPWCPLLAAAAGADSCARLAGA
jgi:hypothetical protein